MRGEGRIRTSEARKQQIYSLSPLAAREPPLSLVFAVYTPKNLERTLELAKGIEPPTC